MGFNSGFKGLKLDLLTRCPQGQGTFKAIPLQAWTDPEVSRRLRLPDFKTIGT